MLNFLPDHRGGKGMFLHLPPHLEDNKTPLASATAASPPPSLRQRALQDTTSAFAPCPGPRKGQTSAFCFALQTVGIRLQGQKARRHGCSGHPSPLQPHAPAPRPPNLPCSSFRSAALMRVLLRQLSNEELI